MTALNLPTYDVRLSDVGGRHCIFDVLRRRFVALTPEEWVRQHFVHFLIERKGYPPTLLQNEVELRCGQKRLRCDSVLYNSDGTSRMIIEYKAPEIEITPRVFNQIAAYNFLLHVDYLIVSNGLRHFCCRMDYEHNSYAFLSEIPSYTAL